MLEKFLATYLLFFLEAKDAKLTFVAKTVASIKCCVYVQIKNSISKQKIYLELSQAFDIV